MPFIKLKQKRGEYCWNGRKYVAGRIEEVTDKEAYYLVHQEKLAEVVLPETKKQMDKQEEINKTFRDKEKGKIKIALFRLGGMGDAFLLGCHAKAIRRKYPNSYITLYIRDKFEPLNEMEAVDRVVIAGNANWDNLLHELKQKGYYDIIFDNKYITKVIYADEKKFSKQKWESDKLLGHFKHIYDGWIRSCHKLDKMKISTFDLFYKSTGLEGGEEDIVFPLKKEHFKFSQLLAGTKYVTVHNGADISRQTKCWPTSHWSKLVAMLKKRGYKVIQVGKSLEEEIEGVQNLCGMTSIFETAGLIAQAEFHIDTEGGLVHIAKGVGTRCIVLFGPTPIDCFGYKDNINIVSSISCRGCWWSTDFWWRDCPQGYELPKCMKEITPDMVYDKVEVIEKMEKPKRELSYDPNDVNEKFAMELELTEGHYKSEKHQWERVNIMMDEVKGPKVLEVGAGDGYCSLVLRKRGFDVTATELSEIRLQRMRDAGLDPVKADLINLPFPDNSFDSVICGEVLEHIPNWWEGMKELERVLKPDGKLILSWPIHPDYDGLGMHLWSIRQFLVNRNGHPDLTVQVFRRIHREDNTAE